MRTTTLVVAILLLCTSSPSTAQVETADPPVAPEFLGALSYRSVGPFRGGRVTAVSGVVQDPHLFYMGSTGGGVWKSDDAGESWTNITDGQFKAGAIGSIAVAPSDPNVIYVGTGSADIRGNISPGIGMYRSTDAGKTWTHVGLDKAGQIGRIQIHPANPDLVFAAALGSAFGHNEERGVYRSRDGGDTWENVLFVSDSTGAVDVAMDVTNPRILFASAWHGRRKPWTLESGSMDGGIYRSKDGGDTWKKLGGGLPTGMFGKSGVVVSPANPNRVWAIIEAGDNMGGLYRSDNGGDTWRNINKTKSLYHRPWYYNHVFADPIDANTVWVTNVFLYKSVDGGADFVPVLTPHPDTHVLWINPNDTDIMVEGDDGGATVTLNGGRTWSTQRNQPTAEMYRVTVDNQFPYRIYGSQQDNSTMSVPSRLSPGVVSDAEEEYQVGGCESGHIAVDPRDTDIVYAGCYGGSITRFSRKTGQIREIIPYPELQLAQDRSELKYRFQWNAPIRLSPHDPDVLYQTSQVVHRSTNAGQSWEVISPDLSYNDSTHQGFAGGPITADGTGVEVYGTIFAFEESPHEAGTLWAGTDDGRIHISRDNGGNWTEITPGEFPHGATVNTIDLSAHGPGRATVSAFRYRENDNRPYIYQTDDYGATWTSLADGTNGIPDGHFVRVVREDPVREGLLFAGTEFGMFVSLDNGTRWQSLQRNLPVTPITDMVLKNGDLVLSTQGRSFWVLDDVTPLRTLDDSALVAAARLYPPRPVHRASFGGGLALGPQRRGKNPPAGAMIHYSLGSDVDEEVLIQVISASGDTVKTFSSEKADAPDLGAFAAMAAAFGFGGQGTKLGATKGLHRVAWDLTHPAPKLPKGTVLFGMAGPIPALPAVYTVRMSVGTWSEEHPLEVLPDPRQDVPAADLQAQFDIATEMADLINELARRMDHLRSVHGQVESLSEHAKKSDLDEASIEQVDEAARSILDNLGGVENEVRQTKSVSFYDPLDYPGQLIAQLVNVYTNVVGGFGGSVDAAPTDGAVERFREVEAEAGEILNRLETIMNDEVGSFNDLLESVGLKPVIVPRSVDEGGVVG